MLRDHDHSPLIAGEIEQNPEQPIALPPPHSIQWVWIGTGNDTHKQERT